MVDLKNCEMEVSECLCLIKEIEENVMIIYGDEFMNVNLYVVN